MSASSTWLYIVTTVLVLIVPAVGVQLSVSQRSRRRRMGIFASKNHLPVDGRVSPLRITLYVCQLIDPFVDRSHHRWIPRLRPQCSSSPCPERCKCRDRSSKCPAPRRSYKTRCCMPLDSTGSAGPLISSRPVQSTNSKGFIPSLRTSHPLRRPPEFSLKPAHGITTSLQTSCGVALAQPLLPSSSMLLLPSTSLNLKPTTCPPSTSLMPLFRSG